MKKFLSVLTVIGVMTAVSAFGADQWYVKNTTLTNIAALVSTTNTLVKASAVPAGQALTSISFVNTNAALAVNVYAVNSSTVTSLVQTVNAGVTYSPVHTYPDISGTSYYVRGTSNAVNVVVVEQDGGPSGTTPTMQP